MSITHVATNTYINTSDASGNVFLSSPPGTLIGDLLIATIFDNTHNIATPPAGWTTQGSIQSTDGFFTTAHFTRLAAANGAVVFNFGAGGGADYVDASLSAYRSVDQTTPMDVASGIVANAASTGPFSSTLNPVTAGDMFYAVLTVNGTTTEMSAFGMTSRAYFDNSFSVADLFLTTTSPVHASWTLNFGSSAATTIATAIAVRPDTPYVPPSVDVQATFVKFPKFHMRNP